MVRQAGLFDVEERLRELSAKGDDPSIAQQLTAINSVNATDPA
jgi:hypothetical protein